MSWTSHQAINLLPANTQIREIRVFLESVLEEKAQRKRCNQVLKSLLQAEFLRVSAHDIDSADRWQTEIGCVPIQSLHSFEVTRKYARG